jgi:hypothetical protein
MRTASTGATSCPAANLRVRPISRPSAPPFERIALVLQGGAALGPIKALISVTSTHLTAGFSSTGAASATAHAGMMMLIDSRDRSSRDGRLNRKKILFALLR